MLPKPPSADGKENENANSALKNRIGQAIPVERATLVPSVRLWSRRMGNSEASPDSTDNSLFYVPNADGGKAGTRMTKRREFSMPLWEARRRFERRYFRYWLKREGGNMKRLAQCIGLERTTLYRKLWGLGISTRRG